MSVYGVPNVPDAAIENAKDAGTAILGEHLANQPWWKRRSNTVTAAVTLLAGAVASGALNGLLDSTLVAWITMLVTGAVAVVAVANTRNGITTQDAKLVDAVVTDPRVIAPIADAAATPTGPTTEGPRTDPYSGR